MLILSEHLRDGHRRAGDLASALGIQRSTLTRAFEREPELIRVGRARSTAYALPIVWQGLDQDRYSIYRVDEDGRQHADGSLITLAGNESIWEPNTTIVDGLRVELHDIAPRGFLGRSFARRHTDLHLPDDVTNWSDHHVLIALTQRGEDLPGNLIVGDASLSRFEGLSTEPVSADDFHSYAEAAMAGEHAGSSAGGEQPKFTAFYNGEHRIIKFANDTTDNTRRWQDLLALEHLASQTLHDHGIASAESELLDHGNMRYLIVRRFDRVAARGRRSVITLAGAALANDAPINATWTEAASTIEIGETDRARIELLDDFGALIANTDRHLYNIVLYSDQDGYRLAPSFDQLPMAYAPPASGNLRMSPIALPEPSQQDAAEMARDYWSRASGSSQVSGSMSGFADVHLKFLST